MTDSRVVQLAKVLVNYSLAIQPGEEMVIVADPLAQELTREVYREGIIAGGHVLVMNSLPGGREIFFKHASDEQLDYVSPVQRMVLGSYSAVLNISATANTRELAGTDPARIARSRRASAELMKTYMERSARGELKTCTTIYPTQAYAQDADMSLAEFEDFVYSAGMLDRDDPVGAWQERGRKQGAWIAWLSGKKQVVLKGANIDMSFSIEGRTFIDCSGKQNFPDGEIFTAPIEASVNGWVKFGYPAIYSGQEVHDIELWFEDGRVVKEAAGKGEALLRSVLDTDAGSRTVGEWGIGTNEAIQRFTKQMLFDEKIGGTIHLALGAGFPESGSKNESSVHWDMLCDMSAAEILVDGELFYKDGQIQI